MLAGVLAGVSALIWPTTAPQAPRTPPVAAAPTPQPTESVGLRTARTTDADAPQAPAAIERTAGPVGAQHAQGLRGRLIDASGAPIAGVAVHLHESPDNEPMMLALPSQRRHLLTPVAAAESDHRGGFALGLQIAEDKAYDVFVRSPEHATVRLAGLRLLAEQWHDIGEVTLEPGATLRGRVTVADRPLLPAPQAVVTVTSGAPFADAAAPSAPGALFAYADHDGYYELKHAPTRGVIRVSAVAPGFAMVIKGDVEMHTGRPVTVDFALPTGLTLVGAVQTASGAPIAEACVTAWPKQAGMPEVKTYSDARGAFALAGLQRGKHLVVVTARGFAKLTQNDVEAPASSSLDLTLSPQHRIQVKVTTPQGAVLRRYHLALRRFFPAQPAAPFDAAALEAGKIGALREVPEQRVRLDLATDHAEIVGIPDGIFVCEVRADGWAKSLSLPLALTADRSGSTSPPLVEVLMSHGAQLRGRVVDETGRPVAGASVTTRPAGAMLDNPLMRTLQSAAPPRITRRTTQTDERGRFHLEQLAAAKYQLQIEHPDKCREITAAISLKPNYGIDLQDVQMRSGATIRGTAKIAGKTVGQMKVILTSDAATTDTPAIRLETVTDREGGYSFTRPIPPGSYVIQAATVGRQQPDTEIFQQMLQLRKSTTTFRVTPGQRVVEQHLNLPAN